MTKSALLPGLMILSICLLAVIGTTDVSWGATPHVNAGGNHTAALKADGTIWAWGENTFGQLGDGSLVSRNVPVKIGTGTTWTAVAAGFFHAAALKSDGSLWIWGDNSKGQLGDGGIAASSAVPTRVGIATDWAAIAVGDFHTLALKADGSLWAWGENASGQIGNGAVVPGIQSVPVRIGTDSDWIAIAAGGSHSIALKANHTLWGWGSNAAGQLGNGTIIDAMAPVRIDLPAPFINNDWNAVASGQSHSVALKLDGALWSWGSNVFGQLGNSTILNSTVPVRETGGANNWVAVSAGDFHTVGRRSDGTLWAWGGNARGQLGNGTNTDELAPQKIGLDSDWVESDAGSVHTVALKANGTVWSWGDNASGQVGDGTNSPRNAPVIVAPPMSLSVVTDKTSPQNPGIAVLFTATASGGFGAPYQYQFWLKDTTGVYTLVQPFSDANAWNWSTAGLPAGAYSVAVQAKTVGANPPNGFEAEIVTDFVLAATAATTLDVQAAPGSPQRTGTPVSFTATAGGGSGPYEYQFWLKDTTGVYTLVKPFSSANIWNWAAAGPAPGAYFIAAQAKSKGSIQPNGFDVETVVSFQVTPAPATALDVATQVSGTDVSFTGTAGGGTGPYEYQFWLKDLTGVYTLVKPFSASNVWTWPTAGLSAGAYSIAVQAKSSGSVQPNGFDVETVVTHVVGP